MIQKNLPLSLVLTLAFSACGFDNPSRSSDPCSSLKTKIASCFSEQMGLARCTTQTMSQLEQLESMSCDQLAQAAKADTVSFSECGPDEHTCAGFFCCKNDNQNIDDESGGDPGISPEENPLENPSGNPYAITWTAQVEDFDIISSVLQFQSGAPVDIQDNILYGEVSDSVRSETYYDDILGHDMIVEVTRGYIRTPIDSVMSRMDIQDWGVNLADYLGGEVKVYAKDEQGRASQQVERMVLSTLQSELGLGAPLDMTKVEALDRRANGATVFWRVMHSDNGTVIADVGSLDFSEVEPGITAVTFFSAHKLSGIMPKFAVATYLSYYFKKAIRQYISQLQ